MKQLTVVAAAIKEDGVVYSLPAPARHSDVITHIIRITGKPSVGKQGFKLSDGEFVSRGEAYIAAWYSGQVSDDSCKKSGEVPDKQLYSEDIW